MVQSINSNVELTTSGVSYLSLLGGKVGKFLLGDQGLEFYNNANVNDYIQIPWGSIEKIGGSVSRGKVGRHFQVFTDKGKFLFASKDAGRILKIARKHIGNEKVVKLPTLVQTIGYKLQNLFAKKENI